MKLITVSTIEKLNNGNLRYLVFLGFLWYFGGNFAFCQSSASPNRSQFHPDRWSSQCREWPPIHRRRQPRRTRRRRRASRRSHRSTTSTPTSRCHGSRPQPNTEPTTPTTRATTTNTTATTETGLHHLSRSNNSNAAPDHDHNDPEAETSRPPVHLQRETHEDPHDDDVALGAVRGPATTRKPAATSTVAKSTASHVGAGRAENAGNDAAQRTTRILSKFE